MEITVTITPGLSPIDRGTLEDQLAEAIGGEVEFLGGGTLMGDPMVSDFDLGLPEGRNEAEVAAICGEFLGSIAFSLPTEVTLEIDGRAYPVVSATKGRPST